MYKLLIADDNKITRESIILTMDWINLDCKVIGDSDNGVDAFKLTKKYLPDIVITDIKMPDMDGLQFTEKVKSLFPWIKVIIITGYSEFSYAQKAIKFGAFDFILKPIDNEELFNVIKKAVSDLNANRKEQYEKESMKNTIANSKDQLIAKLIIDSISGIKTTDTYKYIETLKKYFIFTTRYKINFRNMDDDGFRSFIEGSKQAAEALKAHFRFEFIYFWLNDKFTIVVSENNRNAPNKLSDNILKICNCFVDNNPLLNIHDYSIGVSRVQTNYNEIKNVYNQSIDAIDYRFFYPKEKIITADLIKNNCILSEHTMMKKVYDNIKNRDLEKILQVLDEINDTLMEEKSPVSTVKNLLSNICFVAFDYFYDDKIFQFNNDLGHAEISADMNDIDNLEGAISYVKNYIGNLLKNSNSTSQKNYSKVTMQVMNYLYDHYDKKISLQEIADYVCLTPTHLCRVIKKDTGESFVDLFNKIKIGVAEKLLKESNLKVYEVANKVGIENYSYFTMLFKKFTGIAPTKYYKKSI